MPTDRRALQQLGELHACVHGSSVPGCAYSRLCVFCSGSYFSIDSIKAQTAKEIAAGKPEEVVREYGQLLNIVSVSLAGTSYLLGKVKMYARNPDDDKSPDFEPLGPVYKKKQFQLLTVDTQRADPFGRMFLPMDKLTGQVMLAPLDSALSKPAGQQLRGRCYILPADSVVRNADLAADAGVAAAAASLSDAGDPESPRPAATGPGDAKLAGSGAGGASASGVSRGAGAARAPAVRSRVAAAADGAGADFGAAVAGSPRGGGGGVLASAVRGMSLV